MGDPTLRALMGRDPCRALTTVDASANVGFMPGVSVISVPRPLRLFALSVLAAVMVGVGPPILTSATASAAPAVLTMTPAPSPSPTTAPPTAPSNLVATSVGSHSVTLSWTASAAGCCGLAGYDISYNQRFNDIFWSTSVGNVTTVTITANIAATQEYRFYVMARDSTGRRSTSSNLVTVVTPLSDSGPDTVPPSAVTGLTATNVTPATATLTWSPSTDNVGVTGYNVYRYDGVFNSTLVTTVTGTTYTGTRSALYSNIYVRARDAVGNVSIASDVISLGGGGSTPGSPPPVSPTASPSPSVSQSACRVTYTTTAQWTQGFVASVTVANTGQTPITGWTLSYTFGGDQQIASAWNATVSQSGSAVTANSLAWNGVIAAGSSTSFGMYGSWSASNAPPAAFAVNGVSCAVG
jgi:hypothetical protein